MTIKERVADTIKELARRKKLKEKNKYGEYMGYESDRCLKTRRRAKSL